MMSKLPKVVLSPGREKSIRNLHPWIFSGAVAQAPECEDGALVEVYSASGDHLGSGYYNSKSSIRIRMLCFDKRHPLDALRASLQTAFDLRARLQTPNTDGYRVINAEGDAIPGLIVDRYRDVVVVQVGTLGIEKLKAEVLQWILETLKPRSVYEKSNLPSRKEEGLSSFEGALHGEKPELVEFKEYGHLFFADVAQGQKTGFFLDQKEMRRLVGDLSRDRCVLNCFCYSGGFSVYALKGGAARVTSVDVSSAAIQLAERTLERNGAEKATAPCRVSDAFDFLREQEVGTFDFIILDPPAFAKRQEHRESACNGYRDINMQALKLLAPGGMLLTCSCSHFVDETLFQQVVFQAARELRRPVRILQRHRHSFDHPVNLFHLEGNYLKSLLLSVE